jgi:hypothetical protein
VAVVGCWCVTQDLAVRNVSNDYPAYASMGRGPVCYCRQSIDRIEYSRRVCFDGALGWRRGSTPRDLAGRPRHATSEQYWRQRSSKQSLSLGEQDEQEGKKRRASVKKGRRRRRRQ